MESKLFVAIPWVVFLPAIGAVLAGLLGRRLGDRFAAAVATAAMVASFGVTAYAVWFLYGEANSATAYFYDLYSFVDTRFLSIHVAFQLDRLSAVMALVVTGFGSLIHLYSIRHMKGEGYTARYFSYLNMFAFFMLLLALGNNLLVMFAGWEGVALSSYLLIGFRYEDMARARAGTKALIINYTGAFGFLLAMMMIVVYNQGSLDYVSLQEWVSSGASPVMNVTNMSVICLLLVAGVVGKLAQMPLCVRFLDGQTIATRVGAWTHAAALFGAGVYVVARLSFLFDQAPLAMPLSVGVGGLATAWILYRAWLHGPVARLAEALGWANPLAPGRHYFDDAASYLLVRPLRRVSRFCYRVVDTVLIDLFVVQGSARAVRLFGLIPRALHNGNVQNYLLAIVIGLACLWIVL